MKFIKEIPIYICIIIFFFLFAIALPVLITTAILEYGKPSQFELEINYRLYLIERKLK
jgi:hypothetical protein